MGKNLSLLIMAVVLLIGGRAAAGRPLTNFTGVVTCARGSDRYFFLRDDAGTDWRAEGGKSVQDLAEGDLVAIRGLPEQNSRAPRLFNCTYRRIGHDDARIPVPERWTIARLYSESKGPTSTVRDWYAHIVRIEGDVRDVNRRQSITQLLIGEGGQSVQVSIMVPLAEPLPDGLAVGARVAVTGPALYTTVRDRDTREVVSLENYSMITDRVDRVEVLSRPPFWTPVRFWLLIGTMLVVGGVAFAWILREKRIAAREADAVSRERLRLSHDLHDNIQQLLAGTMFRLDAVGNLLREEPNPEAAREQLAKAKASLRHTQAGLRSILWGLTEESEGPAELSGLFRYAAGRLAHWEGRVTFAFSGTERREARALGGRLLMVLQESVGNALAHGRATHVAVAVEFCAKGVVMRVRDDGCGFDASVPPGSGHCGIEGMRDRVREMDGRLKIESAPGRGTLVIVAVPYPEEKKNG